MKKIIISMSALLMVVSCMNEKETTPVVTGETFSYFTAGFEGQEPAEEATEETKTVLNTKEKQRRVSLKFQERPIMLIIHRMQMPYGMVARLHSLPLQRLLRIMEHSLTMLLWLQPILQISHLRTLVRLSDLELTEVMLQRWSLRLQGENILLVR